MKKQPAEHPCIAPKQVRKQLQNGGCVQIIDVRSLGEYEERHIPEAIHIPLDELEGSISSLNRNCILVTACGKGGGRSAEGTETLRRMGFDSAWLCGGTFGWLDEK